MAIALGRRNPAVSKEAKAVSFLQRREQLALLLSNGMAAMGSRMQLLLHGWLIVAWGHNLYFLIVFAAARILPKLLLTVPAGLFCDRVPRARVLSASRWTGASASILPLAGFVLPLPLAWLIGGIVVSGATHVFDQPARRAVLGDITEREQLGPVVALNNASAHAASLCGSLLAFALGPAGLVVSAIFLIGAALIALGVQPDATTVAEPHAGAAGMNGFFQFMVAAPAVSALLLIGIVPPLLDKGLALALPSIDSGWAAISLALLAPDIGAILAATILFARPVRFPFGWIIASVACYAVLLTVGLSLLRDPALLIVGLLLAGMAKSVFDTTSQVRVQEVVPASFRGRVFAL
jgi:MFS family permease